MEYGAKGLAVAAVASVGLGGLRALDVVHFDVDEGTKFMLGLGALLGLVALFQGRITKVIVPGGATLELASIKQAVETVKANTERLSDRQDELAAPKMAGRILEARDAIPMAEAPVDAHDLNKGRFGGLDERNGLILAADVSESSIHSGWFRVDLRVQPKSRALDQSVTFYLHESYDEANRVQVVKPVAGVARLTVLAWGAFTVGAVTDDGQTQLELDLSEDSRFPLLFRKR
jgi:hypothetical protein